MTLAALQTDFRAWLVDGSDVAADRLGAGPGLLVYQNNYRAQLVGALQESLPLTLAWIGEEAFVGAAVAYIDRQPPSAWTLDAYAPGFAQSLVGHFPGDPEVADLAWIETALGEAFVARDAKPLALQSLEGIDWERARLRLCPSLRMRAVTTNALDIWTALSEHTAPPPASTLEQTARIIVWRRDFKCVVRGVDEAQGQAFDQLQADPSFAALCEFLVFRHGPAEGPTIAGALLATLLQSGMLAQVEVGCDASAP
ncbi:HvfC/BufC N-terminal domain-containing protein [Caulobacter sp. NIBR2454]|uniref:HvfC/BufC N-terminal domain-containing protein n=1 Tax=Caulobacter sp. NIBR2454 TaxID=3015996 RepID=UPI0022B66881|nr:DNA-binding domain-containing protein [Caulobacter sp. NIBR2454]